MSCSNIALFCFMGQKHIVDLSFISSIALCPFLISPSASRRSPHLWALRMLTDVTTCLLWHRRHVGCLASYHTLSKARHPADLIPLFLEITEASLGGSISEYIIQSWIWCLGCTGSEVTYQSGITAGGDFIMLSPQVSFAHNLDWKVKMKMLSKFIKTVSQGGGSQTANEHTD